MRRFFHLLALFVVLALATVARADTLRPCNVGADPVDPTYQWVPPLDWKLVKTTQPEPVTQRGGHGEYRCELPPGHVLAYPPGGGNPLVVLCKNEITAGRPKGNEIPRESIITFNVTHRGEDGEPGPAGTSCWDTNNDGVGDPEEDMNRDGRWDSRDCRPVGRNITSGHPRRPLCGESWKTGRRWGCFVVGAAVVGLGASALGGGDDNKGPGGITGGNF